jgi:hypothetical protein
MDKICYAVVTGEYEDREVGPIFQWKAWAKRWISSRRRPLKCDTCNGSKIFATMDGPKPCFRCEGTGIMKGDGRKYHIETLEWNPIPGASA